MSAFTDTFPAGFLCDPGPFAPTGEPFIAFAMGGFQSLNDAEAAAHATFNEYASKHSGNLYWRIMPHTEHHPNGKYTFYMRLLISDKAIDNQMVPGALEGRSRKKTANFIR